MSKKLFIWEYDKKDRLLFYKAIKRRLLEYDLYSFENLENAMNNKVKDVLNAMFGIECCGISCVEYPNEGIYNELFEKFWN